MNKVIVNIFGRDYSLLSNKKKDDIIRIATFVDDEIQNISSNAESMSRTDIAILACNNIAEKYFDAVGSENSNLNLTNTITEQIKEIANLKLLLEQKDVKIQSLEMTDVSSKTLQAQIEKMKIDYEAKIKEYQDVNDELQSEFYNLQLKIAKYEQDNNKDA